MLCLCREETGVTGTRQTSKNSSLPALLLWFPDVCVCVCVVGSVAHTAMAEERPQACCFYIHLLQLQLSVVVKIWIRYATLKSSSVILRL